MSFDPSTLTGKLFWFRAKDLAGANGASVTSWADQSGFANDLNGISGTTIVTGATPSAGRVARLSGGVIPMDNPGYKARALVAHASSTYQPAGSFYPVDNLLDGNSGSEWAASTNALPQKVKLRVVAGATVVTSYNLRATSGQTTSAPAAWTFEGSNDGSTWTTLDTRSGVSLSSASETTFSFTNSTAYLLYRMNVSARNGSSTELRFAEFNLGGITTGSLVAGAASIWIVVKSNSTSGQFWQLGASGQQSHYSFSGTVYDDFGTTTRDTFTPTMSISSAYRIVHVTVSTSGEKIWKIDNVVQARWTGRTLGSFMNALLANGWSGDIVEVLGRTTVDTADEERSMTDYFNTEHGLSVSLSVQYPVASPSASTTGGATSAANAFDGDATTQWLSSSEVNGAWVRADAGSSVQVHQYAVGGTVSGHETKAPKTWSLQGSPDGTTWTTVDTQTNASAFSAAELRTYVLTADATYRYWRLLFTSSQGDVTTVGVSEFKIYSPATAPAAETPGGAGLMVNRGSASRIRSRSRR